MLAISPNKAGLQACRPLTVNKCFEPIANKGGSIGNQVLDPQSSNSERPQPVISPLHGNPPRLRSSRSSRKSATTAVLTVSATCHGVRPKPRNARPQTT